MFMAQIWVIGFFFQIFINIIKVRVSNIFMYYNGLLNDDIKKYLITMTLP